MTKIFEKYIQWNITSINKIWKVQVSELVQVEFESLRNRSNNILTQVWISFHQFGLYQRRLWSVQIPVLTYCPSSTTTNSVISNLYANCGQIKYTHTHIHTHDHTQSYNHTHIQTHTITDNVTVLSVILRIHLNLILTLSSVTKIHFFCYNFLQLITTLF